RRLGLERSAGEMLRQRIGGRGVRRAAGGFEVHPGRKRRLPRRNAGAEVLHRRAEGCSQGGCGDGERGQSNDDEADRTHRGGTPGRLERIVSLSNPAVVWTANSRPRTRCPPNGPGPGAGRDWGPRGRGDARTPRDRPTPPRGRWSTPR